MKQLTRAEEQVMQILWELKKGFLKDVVEGFPEPTPAYTTVSTVIRVLTKKGFISFKTYGKTNEYFPTLTKAEYFKNSLKPIINNYIEGSPTRLASFFTNESISLSDLEEIRQLIDERIKKLKKKK
ncbi:MAG TPA: BlaI/MecI/CopY family transcriptional regulator [Cyclobacteriaceae bacterium]